MASLMIRSTPFGGRSPAGRADPRFVSTKVMTPDEAHDILVKQRSLRPTSPHLTIYRPQMTWYLSGLHRITGVALAGGFYAFGLSYLAAPYLGIELTSATLASAFGALPLVAKVGLKTVASIPFTFHAFNGVRHLVWDLAVMVNNKGVIKSGYASALEGAHIALLGASATAAEALKDLVLPGIGRFTVVDDRPVTADDEASNFFVGAGAAAAGVQRAAAVCELVQELNSDSAGAFDVQALAELDRLPPTYWDSFTLVVAYRVRPAVLAAVAATLWAKAIPLVVVNSVGFYGYVRHVVPEHTVVESHPDSTVDLRLDCPWPELAAYATELADLDALDEIELAHVPYVLLLLILLDKFRAEHGGPPKTSADKDAFRALIRKHMRSPDEENFDEALAAVWRATQETTAIDADTPAFWVLVRAVADFVAAEGAGRLPLSGTLPDMKADSSSYVKLINIYRDKARADREAVAAHVDRLLAAVDRPGLISPEEVESFCKHARFLVVQRGRPLAEQLAAPGAALRDAVRDDPAFAALYAAVYAAELFEEAHGRYPGAGAADVAADERALAGLAADVLAAAGAPEPPAALAAAVAEVARAGGGELHPVAALVGAVAAQEITKLITHQYVPAANTVLYDGIASGTVAWAL
ncbi:uncharacterized protein V1510DRAFT_447023 [Dipodascopsis tothii]|uniref:uncharacterized protein n=1 Tax=Dipodascopsis tothii TaxID=44089 RepID=UPI0034CF4DBA